MSQFNTLVTQMYLMLLSFTSAAIPLGAFYLKFDWLGALICVAYGLVLLSTKSAPRFAITYSFLFMLYLFIQGAIVLLTDGGNLTTYSSYLSQFLLAMLVFISISSMKLTTIQIEKILNMWVVIGCVAGLLAIAQKLSGQLLVDKYLFIPYYKDNMISSKIISDTLAVTAWFSEASWLAAFLVVPTMSMLYIIFKPGSHPRRKLVEITAVFLLGAAHFLSYSLTGEISVFVGIGAMLVLSSVHRWKVYLFLCCAVPVALIFSDTNLLVLQIQRFSELISNLADYQAGSEEYGRSTSFYMRSIGFTEGFSAFIDNPFLGHGLGQSPMPYHSGLITLLAELGVIGAIIYLSLPVIAILKLSQIAKKGGESDRRLASLLIVCLIADYANGIITHNAFHLQRWFLISLVISWVRRIASVDSNGKSIQLPRFSVVPPTNVQCQYRRSRGCE